MKSENVKKCITHAKEKTEKFWDNHKKILIPAGIGITSITIFFLGYKSGINHNMKIMSIENEKLNKRIQAFEHLIENRNWRIKELENLCSIKDSFFDKAISEGLRKGGSFGAQQMAYKRWYY